MKRSLAILFVLSISLAMLGCGDKASSGKTDGVLGTPGTAGQPAAGMGAASRPSTPKLLTVNAQCPITSEDVDSTVTVDFQGKKVGFCCEDCLAKWDDLSDAEKLTKINQ